MSTYRLTRQGRLMTLILMVGVVLLWVFALLSLPGVLGIRYSDLVTTLGAALAAGLDASELIPAVLLVAMLVAAPLVGWALIEEWGARYTVASDALTYQTVSGITIQVPWRKIRGLRQGDGDEQVAE